MPWFVLCVVVWFVFGFSGDGFGFRFWICLEGFGVLFCSVWGICFGFFPPCVIPQSFISSPGLDAKAFSNVVNEKHAEIRILAFKKHRESQDIVGVRPSCGWW